MLHEFIAVNRDEIIRRCRAKVAARSVPPPTEAEIDHGPLVAISERKRHPRAPVVRGLATSMSKSKSKPTLKPIDAVDWTGVRLQRVEYQPAAMIFAQGDPATSVMYVEKGAAA